MAHSGQPSLLDVIEPEARRALMAQTHIIQARRGQTVLSRGEASANVLLLQEGRLRALLYAADGQEVSLRELSPGSMIGELSAIDGAVRSVSVVATTDCRMLAIPQRVFQDLVDRSPGARDWLIQRLVQQVRSLTDRVFELSALNVRTRLHCELLRLARAQGGDVAPSPTHAELANRIATQRETVTRELGVLEERKVLRSGRRRLEFLDIEKLDNEVQAKLRAPVASDGGW